MLGCSWSVTKKRDQAKKQSVTNLFPKILSLFEHKKLQCRSLLEQHWWLPLKWLSLRENETQRTCLRLPSLPYSEFVTRTPRVCTGVR